MGFFIFLVALMIFLIVITIITTIIKLSLMVTTKYKYETYILIVPSILFILLWGILFFLWFIMSDNYTNGGIVNLAFETVLNSNLNIHDYTPSLICLLICCMTGIIIQPLIFLSVNIPYGNIRVTLKKQLIKLKKWFITKILKKDLKPELMPTSDVMIKEKWVKLKYPNALISSIFSFAIIFFAVITLLFCSNIISKKILEKIPKQKMEQTDIINNEENKEEQDSTTL